MQIPKYFLFVVLSFLIGCGGEEESRLQFVDKNRPVPEFNADSAYAMVQKQVQIGPRNPGSKTHRETKTYLLNKLKSYAGSSNVYAQNFSHRGYEGDTLEMSNIIAAFNLQSTDRIMLCAHWDTRPRAERDSSDSEKPILGADDGASGVAVLLEMARLFNKKMPPIGVDIVLFDGEDYGREGDIQQYFLGSRYWSNNPPVKNYRPRFGILLDMVGGEDATFPKEINSMDFAPALVNEVWSIAEEKGYGLMFENKEGARVSDDHIVIQQIRNIPVINIIRHTSGPEGEAEFAPYWHTQNDNLDIIDKRTLKAVGEVMAELVYNRI